MSSSVNDMKTIKPVVAVTYLDKTAHSYDAESNKDVQSHKYDDEVSYGKFFDSFRPKVENDEAEDPKLLNILTSRQIQMIAIGGSIGSGLFIGSGAALATGGPAMVRDDLSPSYHL
jgi:amino acid permease